MNSELPFGVDRDEFFPALAGTIQPPPILEFYPLGSPSGFSGGGEMGAIPPLPSNPATGTPPPAALPIDPQVTLAPPLASEASYRPQQDPPPPGCHENLVAVKKKFVLLFQPSSSAIPNNVTQPMGRCDR